MSKSLQFDQQCPACGQQNQCSVSNEANSQTCWCFSAKIDTSTIDSLPPDERSKRCLCPTCAGVAVTENHYAR